MVKSYSIKVCQHECKKKLGIKSKILPVGTATATATATNKSSLAFGRTSAGNHVVFWGKSVENLFNDPCNAKTHLKWIVKNIFPFQLLSLCF